MTVREALSSLFKSEDELDLTSGGIAKPLFYLSLPIVVTNLLQTAYNIADTVWLGRYSKEALAGISFGFPLVFLLISISIGISIAGSVMVAQHVGADEHREAERVASMTLTLALVASIVVGTGSFLLVGRVIDLLGAQPVVAREATEYMRVISMGLPALFGFGIFVSLLRGYGDTVTPMLVMFGSVALNVVLDPFFIYGWWLFPRMGIEGAAVATVICRGLAFAVGLWLLFAGRTGLRLRTRDLGPSVDFVRRLLRIGVPASVENTGRAISVTLLLLVVGQFSTAVVAGYGIGGRLFSVVFLPAIGVGLGVETMTGQNIGAGNPDRAERTNHFAAKTMFVLLSVVGVIAWLAAGPIVGVFTDNPTVQQTGVEFLHYVAPTFGCIGIIRAYTGGFRGTGKTMIAAGVALLTLGGVRLPVAFYAGEVLGPTGLWLAFTVSNVFGAVLALGWFLRGTWREGDARGTSGASPADD